MANLAENVEGRRGKQLADTMHPNLVYHVSAWQLQVVHDVIAKQQSTVDIFTFSGHVHISTSLPSCMAKMML